MKRGKVAVLVLNWNGVHLLKDCFDSLLQQTYMNIELFLVDNGSTDGSIEFMRGNYPSVKIIRYPENLFYCKAYNRAVKQVDAEYVYFLNNDTVSDPKSIEELVKVLEKDEKIAGVGAKLLFYKEKDRIQSFGIIPDVLGGGWDRGLGEVDIGQYDRQLEVFGITGAAALYRKKVFEEVGGFDEKFVGFLDDVDIAFRTRFKGYKLFVTPKAIVLHYADRSMNPNKVFLLQRNKFKNFIKNFRLDIFLKYLPVLVMTELVILLNYLVRLRFSYFFATLRGLNSFILEAPDSLQKRRKNDLNSACKQTYEWLNNRISISRGFKKLRYDKWS